MAFDPNDPPEPDALPPAPEPKVSDPQPEPDIPLDVAAEVIAREYGYDPRLARFEFEEIKRKREEADRRERQLAEREAALQRYQPPMEFADPSVRALYDEVRAMREEQKQDREAERQRMAEAQEANVQLQRVDSAYENLMSEVERRGLKKIDKNHFFRTMEMLDPDIRNPQNAVLSVYGYINSQLGAPGPMPNGTPRLRPQSREVIIPGGVVQTGVSGEDSPKRKPGETTEHWVMRLRKMDEEAGSSASRIPEGQRVIIE